MFTMRELWQLEELLTSTVRSTPEDHLIALLVKVRNLIGDYEEPEDDEDH